ncbi:unnamed protein product [Merluccius merluccius]
MERVGVDIHDPFPITDSGNHYVLVTMDYFRGVCDARSVSTTAEAGGGRCLPILGSLLSSTATSWGLTNSGSSHQVLCTCGWWTSGPVIQPRDWLLRCGRRGFVLVARA